MKQRKSRHGRSPSSYLINLDLRVLFPSSPSAIEEQKKSEELN